MLYKGDRKDLAAGYGAGIIKFSFYGTGIVLFDYICNNRTQNCTISFDGGNTSEIFSAYGNTNVGSVTNIYPQTAYYVKQGLENKKHDVVINIPSSNSTWFCLDAIDIAGQLLPANESISLNKSTMDLT